MPHVIFGTQDETVFEKSKVRYEAGLKRQIEHLKKTSCPLIGKPCIACDCTAYIEPVKPYKSLTGEMWFERWLAKILNVPFVEPYEFYFYLARCRKDVFSEYGFIKDNDGETEATP
jgi:hypothetical protein